MYQWLEEDFIGFLDHWEESVAQRKSFDKKTRQGFTNKDKKMMLLSAETRLGLRITGEFVTLGLMRTLIEFACFIQ